jgi:hypothetical protein
MKALIRLFVLLMAIASLLALGDPTVLQNVQQGPTSTVNTLNQLGTEEEEETVPGVRENPQDQQERMYEDDKEREEQEWEDSKTIDNYRYDVPE